MKTFDMILCYVFFLAFVTSCSVGIYQQSDNIKHLGIFLFVIYIMTSVHINHEK